MLMAALDLFGQHGFEATTTRMVAQHAGMNLGAIPYYFGAKEDLYTQSATFLADYMAQRQSPALVALQLGASQQITPEVLSELIADFLIEHARLLMTEEVPASWLMFFLRAQTETHLDGFEPLYGRVIAPMQSTLCRLIAPLIGQEPDAAPTRLFTFNLCQQVLTHRLFDRVLVRRMDWESLSPERGNEVLAMLRRTLIDQLMGAHRAHLSPR